MIASSRMSYATRKRTLAAAALGSSLLSVVPAFGATPEPIQDPPVFASEGGTLSVLMIAAKRPGVTVGPVKTDLWTYEVCKLPSRGANACPAGQGKAGLGGVRLALQPGDTLRVRLVNKLPSVAPATADHVADMPSLAGNPTNLHTHGLIVEPHRAVGPTDTYGDYVFLHVRNSQNPLPRTAMGPDADVASDAAEYLYKIEPSHPSGLFWFHPHVHGLSLNQVTAGLAGIITVGSPSDECDGDECKQAENSGNVRHLVLKDTQVAPGGVLKTQQDPNFCTGAPAANRQGSCPGQFPDPSDPSSNYVGGTWLHTVNGQVYPAIEVGQAGDVWRILNASGSRSYNLSVDSQPSNQPLTFQLLAIDGITISAKPGESADRISKLLGNKAKLVPCGGKVSRGSDTAICATSVQMMPSSRVELRIVRKDAGSKPASAVLRTALYNTGDNGAGDAWPAIDLAAVNLASRNPGSLDVVALKDATPKTLSSTGQLLGPAVLQVPGSDRLVTPDAGSSETTAQPSGPALQSIMQAPSIAITPGAAVGKVASQNCQPLAEGHRRRILFGFPTPTTFGLGYVEVDQSGNEMEATRRKIGEYDPTMTMVCVPLRGGNATQEMWDLVNLTDEDHNFHIHQTRFYLSAGGAAPGTTIPAFLNGNLVLHDNVSMPRPANGAPCADGTLEAVKSGACKPTTTTVVIPFREIGDFVFHCHILEHEDGGMMARIRVVATAP